jgi:hypothetical protein
LATAAALAAGGSRIYLMILKTKLKHKVIGKKINN